ncbi:hypothetical protein OE88DRAFT_1740015 [Heliocybe sulcata]|uniref:Mid2 domain-containing protein n=1 Tax=Heliocybe sulcata TaxID=5364 RepID=A0A5C3MLI8_9AGAM|nr:hypothetical protein OE88DRAFT_1740015 [Heliocybe sulcata]
MNQITVDDTNTSAIHYYGSWIQEGQDGEYNSTTHASGGPGVQMMFQFTGTFVEVYGTIGVQGINTSFVLDDGSQTGYTSTYYVVGSISRVMMQVSYYQSPSLPNIGHSLLMTVNDPSATTVFLDYIRYNTTYADTSSMTSSASASVITVTATAPVPSSANSSRTGFIVGIAVAVTVPLAIAALIVWFFMRRFRRPKHPISVFSGTIC